MLIFKKLELVENEWEDGELANLAGEAVLKFKTGSSTSKDAKGYFHMTNCGVGVNASIAAALSGVKSITLNPANLTVELVAHVTRTYKLTADQTVIKTGLTGIADENCVNGDVEASSVSDGDITITAPGVAKEVELDLKVTVATGVAESATAHKLMIESDNEAGFIYFNVLAPVEACVGRKPNCNFEVRGMKPWRSLQDAKLVNVVATALDDGNATVVATA